jgi:hypothetical protein
LPVEPVEATLVPLRLPSRDARGTAAGSRADIELRASCEDASLAFAREGTTALDTPGPHAGIVTQECSTLDA